MLTPRISFRPQLLLSLSKDRSARRCGRGSVRRHRSRRDMRGQAFVQKPNLKVAVVDRDRVGVVGILGLRALTRATHRRAIRRSCLGALRRKRPRSWCGIAAHRRSSNTNRADTRRFWRRRARRTRPLPVGPNFAGPKVVRSIKGAQRRFEGGLRRRGGRQRPILWRPPETACPEPVEGNSSRLSAISSWPCSMAASCRPACCASSGSIISSPV